MSELPEGWTTTRLAEIVSVRKGKKPQVLRIEAAEGFVPYLDIQAIESNRVRQYADITSSRLGKKDDLFVVWDGARSGWVGRGQEGAIGSTIMALEVLAAEPQYLYYFLKSNFDYINSNTRGTGIPHVDPDIFNNLIVPLPPLNEQRRIVKKLEELLSRVDAAQARLATIPRTLKRFRQSVLAAAFSGALTCDWRKLNPNIETGSRLLSRIRQARIKQELASVRRRKLAEFPKPFIPESFDLFRIPETWAWASLAEIGEIVTGKTPSKKDTNFWDGNIIFVMPEDLAKAEECIDLKIITETTNYVTQMGMMSVQHLAHPAVLICCIGTLGRVGVVRQKAAFSQQLNAIIPHTEINLEYLAFYCHTIEPILRELWPRNTYMPIVNKTLFSSIPIPVPPLQEQEMLIELLRRKLSAQHEMEKRANKAKSHVDKLTQSILARAFRGELVTTEAELARQEGCDYEPASALLERIRQERAQHLQVSAKSNPKRPPRSKKDTSTKKMFA